MKLNIPEGKKVILFDGVCNLCNSSVNKVISLDKKNVFLFAALQSEAGKLIIKNIGVDTSKTDSIILYDPGVAYYIKSTAALEIMKDLSGFYKILRIFKFLPEKLRDIVYDFVAKNRYKWYGKKESCMIPTPELKAKFLD